MCIRDHVSSECREREGARGVKVFSHSGGKCSASLEGLNIRSEECCPRLQHKR
jgi:hypothetical protein